ncbi:hypothetical protein, partial [Escherichia coli]
GIACHFTLVRTILMNHESRTVYLNTAIEALLKAEAALNDLALAYELKPDEKASACHPRTGTLSTASQVKKLRRVLEKQKV